MSYCLRFIFLLHIDDSVPMNYLLLRLSILQLTAFVKKNNGPSWWLR